MMPKLHLVEEERDVIIDVHHLAKEYRDSWGRRVRALRDVTLSIETGEVFGILGPNGAGKTTTFGLLLGLQRPSDGSGTLLGRRLGDVEARRRLGYLPENPYFYDYLTPYELLDTFGALTDVPRRERRDRIRAVLGRVGIDPDETRRLRKFSKGMRQRVGLAQAILHDPELVILDEPMSGLDPAGRRLFRDIILGLKEEGKTVVFASHVLPDVEALCDRVAMLVEGRIKRIGTVDELVNPVEGAFELVAADLPESLVAAWRASGPLRIAGNRVIAMAPDNERVEGMVHEVFRSGGRLLAVRPFQATLEEALLAEIDGPTDARKEGVA